MTEKKRRRTALYAAIGVGLVGILFVTVLAAADPADQVAPSRLIGRLAPDVSGPALDGTRYDLASQQGTYVVVNFFATWCVPCVEEHDDLVRFTSTQSDATVVSVVYRDEPDDVRRFFSERGGDWPVVEDEDAKVEWGVRGVPESFLVAPDGVVLTRIVGGVTIDGLQRLLAEAKRVRGS